MSLILCLIAPILSSPDQPGYGSPAPSYPDEPAKYAYQYGVKDDYTSNNFGQAENRDGYSAQGEYFVNLPDGRLQKVTNWFDLILCSMCLQKHS